MPKKLEVSNRETRNQEKVTKIAKQLAILHLDLDHTVSSKGVPRNDEGEFNPEALPAHELESIHFLIELALGGVVPSIITARDASLFPLMRYIQKRMYAQLTANAQTQDQSFFLDGRPKTLDGKPVIFTISNANGTLSADALSHEFIYQQLLPEEFWLGISQPQVRQLLRGSTPRERFELNQAATPQYPQDADTGVTPDSILTAQQLIGDFALISPSQTRVNLRLLASIIQEKPEIWSLWRELTGVEIISQADVRTAFLRLSRDWQVYVTGSNSSPTFDIMHKDVNKAACMEHIHAYVHTLYEAYGVAVEKLPHLAIGDTPDGNDGPMLKRPGGVSVTQPNETVNGWPVYFDQGETPTERTRIFLEWLIATRFSEDA